MTRELQLDAAEAALLVGDAEMLHGLLRRGRGRLCTRRPTGPGWPSCGLKGRVAQNRLQEALETGLRALDELGEPLPGQCG